MVFCNTLKELKCKLDNSHNPYFNRWFSAILKLSDLNFKSDNVTILILIDGFLQSRKY